MEERKNEEQKTECSGKETKKQSGFRAYADNLPVRTCMVMVLAGIYIMYLGYSLCSNVLKGTEGGGPGFMAVGIIFIVIAAGMLIIGIRGVMLDHKRQQEAPQENAEALPEETPELPEEDRTEEAAAEKEPEKPEE